MVATVAALGPVVLLDQRFLSLRADPVQLQSIATFVDSLIHELHAAEGTPPKTLIRELVAKSLLKALDIGGDELRARFLDALTTSIHKFPLQEQQALARVYPVEISSEYRNLVSFVGDALEDAPAMVVGDDDDDVVVVAENRPPEAAAALLAAPEQAVSSATSAANATLEATRQSLGQLPAASSSGISGFTVVAPGAAELQQRLLEDQFARWVQEADVRSRSAFFSDLRLNLFKFSEEGQHVLLNRFAELRADVVRLVESMTQEISRWLDEEQRAARQGQSEQMVPKLRQILKATLSVPFLATFRHLGIMDQKVVKEAFLLRIALFLRTCQEHRYYSQPELGEQSLQLRRHFFHVEGHGELMDDWLQWRLRQLNEEFVQRAATALGRNAPAVAMRLRQLFRPGCWILLTDPQLEEELHALFTDAHFPRHVLTLESISKVLADVSSGCGLRIDTYLDVARLEPPSKAPYAGAPPQIPAEVAMLELLHHFPPFPPMRRLRPGCFRFGRTEVEVELRSSGDLLARARRADGRVEELSAAAFFLRFGAEEFPSATSTAVELSRRLPNGPSPTMIEDPDLLLVGAGEGFAGLGLPGLTPLAGGAYAAPLGGPVVAGGAVPLRTEPYSAAAAVRPLLAPPSLPGASAKAAPMLPPLAPPPAPVPVFGVDDDEI